MPFEIAGEPAHTRSLTLAFTQGEGASIAFRADILDLRKSGLMGLAGRIATAGIIHKMTVSGAFASDSGLLERIDWDQSHVMHEANRATKGECCRDPMERLTALVGTEIGADFVSDLKQAFGGPLGCTHVNTLLQELGATVRLLRREGAIGAPRAPGERVASRSLFFDALFADDGASAALGVRLTDASYAPQDADGNEGLRSHDEVSLSVSVDLAGWKISAIQGRERQRRGPVFGSAAWRDRAADLVDLVERSLGGGITRHCLERFGGRDEDARLLSALLCLSPGMTQVGVALSDSLTPSKSARPGGSPFSGPGPCYMLRAEGPLVASIASGNAAGEEATD